MDLPTPSGPISPDHAVGRNIEGEVVERERLSVAVRYALDACDSGVGHGGSFTASSAGQGILGSVRTKPESAHARLHLAMVLV